MLRSLRNLSTRVTIAIVLYGLVTAAALIYALGSTLDNLASEQLDEIGNALSSQLSETLKPHIIGNNLITTQVILDDLIADTAVLSRATVYSSSNRILAQSQRTAVIRSKLVPYTQPITVDDNMLAQIRLELDGDLVQSEYRSPMWLGVAIWLALTAGLAWLLVPWSRNYSSRIGRLGASFSSTPESGASELDQLEAALTPFTRGLEEKEESDGSAPCYGMLAINIPNLPKWRAQLAADHFSGMLARIDQLIDNHLLLYKADRLHARENSTLLQFFDQGDQHPITRTINCATSLLQLSDELLASQRIPFEIRITAAFRQPAGRGSPWYNDIEREACIRRLLDMVPLAGSGELIIDKQELAEEQLTDCELEDLSAASVWQFRRFLGARQEEYYKQLEFLRSSLS